uniref:CLDND2 n=1 Tax=Steinernema glaseri TaxID=37863 RepID=A0A1I7ZA93_9BILA
MTGCPELQLCCGYTLGLGLAAFLLFCSLALHRTFFGKTSFFLGILLNICGNTSISRRRANCGRPPSISSL